MNFTIHIKDTLIQQTAAEYLERQSGRQSIYGCNHEDFGPDIRFGRDIAWRLYE